MFEFTYADEVDVGRKNLEEENQFPRIDTDAYKDAYNAITDLNNKYSVEQFSDIIRSISYHIYLIKYFKLLEAKWSCYIGTIPLSDRKELRRTIEQYRAYLKCQRNDLDTLSYSIYDNHVYFEYKIEPKGEM